MSDSRAFAASYVERAVDVLRGLPLDDVASAMDALAAAHAARRRVFVAGNGGSAATASHMVNDLVWGMAQIGRPPLRAMSLGDNLALTTAVANDTGYEEIFSQPLRALADPGDVLLVISGSGNSRNVLRALEVARELGLQTIGFLGRGGGQALALCDIAVVVPSDDYGPIEDIHMLLDHLIIGWFRARPA